MELSQLTGASERSFELDAKEGKKQRQRTRRMQSEGSGEKAWRQGQAKAGTLFSHRDKVPPSHPSPCARPIFSALLPHHRTLSAPRLRSRARAPQTLRCSFALRPHLRLRRPHAHLQPSS